MAKENIAKFFDATVIDPALAEKLAAARPFSAEEAEGVAGGEILPGCPWFPQLVTIN